MRVLIIGLVLLVSPLPAAHATQGPYAAHRFDFEMPDHADTAAIAFAIEADEWAEEGMESAIGLDGPAFTTVSVEFGDDVGAALHTATLIEMDGDAAIPVASATGYVARLSTVASGEPRRIEYLLIVASDASSERPSQLRVEYGRAGSTLETSHAPRALASGAQIGMARIYCGPSGSDLALSLLSPQERKCTGAVRGAAHDDREPVGRRLNGHTDLAGPVSMVGVVGVRSGSGDVLFTVEDDDGQSSTATSEGYSLSCASKKLHSSFEAHHLIGTMNEDVHLGSALLPLDGHALGLC